MLKPSGWLFSILFIIAVSTPSNRLCGQEAFLKEIGVCTTFSDAAGLAPHGYQYIEESVGRFLAPDQSEEVFEEILEKATQSPIPVKACNLFLPARLKSVGPEAVHDEILAYAEIVFRRAQRAGVEHIVFGSSGSRSIPDGYPREKALEQFIQLCADLAPIAARYEVVVVLEPLNSTECNFINSVAEGGQIVEAVDHPNIRLLADLYHMLMDGEGPEGIIRYGHLIQHTHIAEKKDRAAPGTHNDDFRPFLAALKTVGYQGRMSVECVWSDMESEASSAIKALRNQLNSAHSPMTQALD